MKQPVRSLSICLSFTLLLLATSYAQLVFAQAETGTISGTVTDSTGSVVPNAKIEIRSVSTGAERSTVTDDRGFYRVSNLLPGLYSVVAQAPNLTKMEIRAEVNGLVVAEGQRSLGAGARLLAAAEDWARKNGCKDMSVRSNVIRDRAHKFYERHGYEHYKTQKSFRKPL